jgi:hypothetical protein
VEDLNRIFPHVWSISSNGHPFPYLPFFFVKTKLFEGGYLGMAYGLLRSPCRSWCWTPCASHFRRFRLTVHIGVKSKHEGTETEAIHFPRPGQESSAADIEDIEIGKIALCPSASSSSTHELFVSELSGMAVIYH